MLVMLRTYARCGVLAIVVTALPLPISAQSSAPLPGGESTYALYCATCHGPAGRGDGPMARMLSKRPADLTRLAERNKGVFDPALVARIVDGRRPVKGHGGGEMPVWGDAFTRSSDPTPATERIEALVSYLGAIQER